MSGYTHFSGPQQDPALSRHGTVPSQSHDTRTLSHALPLRHNRPHNHTGPVGLTSNNPAYFQNYHQAPPLIDMPPYRSPNPDPHFHNQQPPSRPLYQRVVTQEMYPVVNQAQFLAQSNKLSVEQPPELPPKNLSGLQAQPLDPQRYPPPPLPARPAPHLAQEPAPSPRDEFSSEKKPPSGRQNGTDPGLSDALEELKRDPIAAAERFNKVAELLSTWPKRYEAGLQVKTKRLQESVTNAQHDLGILKDELHKARNSLSTSQTGSHVLKGQVQILEQENLDLKNQLGRTEPGETDYSNEETRLLISDLKSQIVKLKSEVPDPNIFDSLRLIIQLLQEDKKILENKYTEVSDELHYRDNEISRLMKENESNGNIIPEGKTGMEKHFNSQLEELRRQNQTLSHQLELTQHKLEVNERRESAENDPGPSRVELLNMIHNADDYRTQLLSRLQEREEELNKLKIQLESSREVMSSSSSSSSRSMSASNYGVSSDSESKLREQVLALELDRQHLENSLAEERRSGKERAERELREQKRGFEQTLEQKDLLIRQLQSGPQRENHQDNEKDDLIQTLLAGKNNLTEENESLKQQREDLKPVKENLSIMRSWLESRDAHILVLNETIEQKSQETAHYKKQYEQFNLRSNQLLDFGNQVNVEKVQLESVVHKYKQRTDELEAKLSSLQSQTPSLSTAHEVFEVQVTQLNKDLEAYEKEKLDAAERSAELEKRNEQLSQRLTELSGELARIKNEGHLTTRYGLSYQTYGAEAARYPNSYAPRPPPHGHRPPQARDPGVPYAQGHDPGVPYSQGHDPGVPYS